MGHRFFLLELPCTINDVIIALTCRSIPYENNCGRICFLQYNKTNATFPLQTSHKQNNTTCNLLSMKIKLYSYHICQLSHKQISLTRNFVWICPQSYPCNDVKADDVNATVTSFLALTPFQLITLRTLLYFLGCHATYTFFFCLRVEEGFRNKCHKT